MNQIKRFILIITAAVCLFQISSFSTTTKDKAIINYGVGESFIILAESKVNTYGENILVGDIGLTTSGSEKPIVMGVHKGEIKNFSDETSKAITAFSNLASEVNTFQKATNITGNIGEQSFSPGVYQGDSIIIQGNMTLDGDANSDGEFIFKVNSLEFSKNSKIQLINGAKAENVVFLVNGDVKINEYSSAIGTIMSYRNIEMLNNTKLKGRLVSFGGEIKLYAVNISCPPSKANYEPVYKKEIRMEIGTANVRINGENRTMDAPAVIKEGYTYVPLSFVTTQLDGKAVANRNSKGKIESITIEFENVKAILTLGDSKAYVEENGNGRYLQTGGKVYIANGRTMVPFKMMGDILNAKTSFGMTKDDSRVEWVLFQK